MPKPVIWGLIALAALAAIWSGGWFALRPSAAAAIEQAIDTARDDGLRVDFDALSVGGFPFSYEAAFENLSIEDPQAGMAAQLPTASAAMSPLSLGEITLTFPDAFTIAHASDNPHSILSVEADALTAALTLAEPGAVDYALSAASLRLTPPTETEADVTAFSNLAVSGRFEETVGERPLEARLSFGDLSFRGGLAPNGTTERTPLELSLKGVALAISLDPSKLEARWTAEGGRIATQADGGETVLGQGSAALTIAPSAQHPDRQAQPPLVLVQSLVTEALRGGGAISLTLEGADLSSKGPAVWSSSGAATGQLAIEGDSVSLTAGLADHRFTLSGVSREQRFQASGLPIPISGAIAEQRITLGYPLKPAPAVEQEADLAFSFGPLRLSQETWMAIDPDGAIPHDGAELSGAMRFGVEVLRGLAPATPQLFAETTPGGPPANFRSLTLDSVDLRVFGVTAAGAGAITWREGLGAGKIDATVTDWRRYIEGLGETPHLDPASAAAVIQMVEGFLQPVDDVTSRITFELVDGLPLLNGQPIGGAPPFGEPPAGGQPLGEPQPGEPQPGDQPAGGQQ